MGEHTVKIHMGYVLIDATGRIRRHKIDRQFGEHVGDLVKSLGIWDPENPKAMFAAMRDGLFRSADAGESWKVVGRELKNMAAVAINPKRTDEVYAASEDGKLYVSTDGGTTWTKRH